MNVLDASLSMDPVEIRLQTADQAADLQGHSGKTREIVWAECLDVVCHVELGPEFGTRSLRIAKKASKVLGTLSLEPFRDVRCNRDGSASHLICQSELAAQRWPRSRSKHCDGESPRLRQVTRSSNRVTVAMSDGIRMAARTRNPIHSTGGKKTRYVRFKSPQHPVTRNSELRTRNSRSSSPPLPPQPVP